MTTTTDFQPRRHRVCAVILTFDARERVEQCLAAVGAQDRPPDTVLVVDNHSSDGTAPFLAAAARRTPSLRVVRTEANLGPAGGFHRGIGWAYEHGAERIWLLDDDSEPAPDCLRRLLAALGDRDDAIAWPRNVDETGRESSYPAWRGELLPRAAVERGGLPDPELFWGQEDTEYLQWRLEHEHGFGRIPVPRAVVRFNDTNPRKRASWHYYYLPRNTIYYRLWVQRPRKPLKLLRALAKFAAKIVWVEGDKLRKARFMALGTWHGLTRRLGKTVDPADHGPTEIS